MGLFKKKKVREKVSIHLGVIATPKVKLISDGEDSHWAGRVTYKPAVELPGEGWRTVHDGMFFAEWFSDQWWNWDYLSVNDGGGKIYGVGRDVLKIWNSFTADFKIEIPLSEATDSETAMTILRGAALEEMGYRRNFWTKSNEVLLTETPRPLQLSGIQEVEVEK